jgi:AraC family transcriptional regulator
MQPTFVEWPEKKIVGLGTRFISALSPDRNNANKIPALWHAFVQRQDTIPHKTGPSFGLVDMLKGGEKSHKDELFYVAGVQVSDFAGAPADMLQRTLPAGRYALFTHKGKLDRLGETMRGIYVEWLPKSGVQLRDAPHLEVYDQRFNIMSDTSELDILLPVM